MFQSKKRPAEAKQPEAMPTRNIKAIDWGSYRGNQSRWGRADLESAEATDLASNARPQHSAAKVRTHSRRSQQPTTKSRLFRVSFGVVFGWGTIAVNGKFVGKCFPNHFRKLLRKQVSIWPVANVRRQASAVFILSKSCANCHPHAIERLRMGGGETSVARRWPGRWPLQCFLRRRSLAACGIPAADIVGACGIICGNGR